MSPETMTEKDQFIAAWDREFETTLKLLKAYPDGQEDFKPAEMCRTARELAWIFFCEEKVIEMSSSGSIQFTTPPPPPPVPMSEITRMYETGHRELSKKLQGMPASVTDVTLKFPVGPGKMADMRFGQISWFMLMDAIHHRGQFSVYLRMVGARVPAIYGPSLDEPWN